MLKFGASQHFQEVSHEPPGTERGEKSVGDEGMAVSGWGPGGLCAHGCMDMCVCEPHMCVACRRRCGGGGRPDERAVCWNGMVGVRPG